MTAEEFMNQAIVDHFGNDVSVLTRIELKMMMTEAMKFQLLQLGNIVEKVNDEEKSSGTTGREGELLRETAST